MIGKRDKGTLREWFFRMPCFVEKILILIFFRNVDPGEVLAIREFRDSETKANYGTVQGESPALRLLSISSDSFFSGRHKLNPSSLVISRSIVECVRFLLAYCEFLLQLLTQLSSPPPEQHNRHSRHQLPLLHPILPRPLDRRPALRSPITRRQEFPPRRRDSRC